jgi:hypothetical protein
VQLLHVFVEWRYFTLSRIIVAFSTQSKIKVKVKVKVKLKVKVKVKVRVTLRLAVYHQSVRLGAKPLGDHDKRFFFFATESLRP